MRCHHWCTILASHRLLCHPPSTLSDLATCGASCLLDNCSFTAAGRWPSCTATGSRFSLWKKDKVFLAGLYFLASWIWLLGRQGGAGLPVWGAAVCTCAGCLSRGCKPSCYALARPRVGAIWASTQRACAFPNCAKGGNALTVALLVCNRTKAV